MKDILSSMVLEGADLDSLLSADVHDTTDSTGKVNDSVPEKKVVVSDDDDDDDDNCYHDRNRKRRVIEELCPNRNGAGRRVFMGHALCELP